MSTILYDDADQALSGVLKEIDTAGRIVSPRGLRTIELSDFQFRIADPARGTCLLKSRRLNYTLVALEFASYVARVGGTVEHAQLTRSIAPNFARFTDDTTGVLNGAYGPRIGEQLVQVVEVLRRDPDSRQARVVIARPDEMERALRPKHPGHEKDFPCTDVWYFRIRDGLLEMSTQMRSNDLYWGTPYDVASFTLVQQLVAHCLERPCGTYTHCAASMHYYCDVEKEMRSGYHPRSRARYQALEPSFEPIGGMNDAIGLCGSVIAARERFCVYDGTSKRVTDEALKIADDEFRGIPFTWWLWRCLTRRTVVDR